MEGENRTGDRAGARPPGVCRRRLRAHPEEVEETARQIPRAGGRALAFTADVSLEADAERVVAERFRSSAPRYPDQQRGVFVLASVLETPVEEWTA